MARATARCPRAAAPGPSRGGCRSGQKIAIRFDEGGKIERMLAREALGKFGIAPLQRLDDAQVVDDRTRRAVALRNRHPADRAHVNEDVLDRVEDDLRLRQLENRLVERDVRSGILRKVLARRSTTDII